MSGGGRISAIRILAESFGVAVIVFALIVLAALLRPVRWVEPPVVWSRGSASAPPTGFRVLMFPIGENVRLHQVDTPEQTLTRAIANSLDELSQMKIAVQLGEGRSAQVDRDQLAFLPDQSKGDELIANWKRAFLQRVKSGLTDQTWAVLTRTSSGDTHVSFQISSSDETQRWTYTTDGRTVTPLEYALKTRVTDAAADIPRVTGFVLAGGGLALVCGVGWFAFRRARRLGLSASSASE